MNETDYGEILQHLRRRMRTAGFADLDARIVQDVRRDPGAPREQLLRYLDLLELEARLGTDATARAVTERLNRIASTESGSPIEGLTVELSLEDQALFGTTDIDVGVAPDLARVIDELRDLRSRVADDRGAE